MLALVALLGSLGHGQTATAATPGILAEARECLRASLESPEREDAAPLLTEALFARRMVRSFYASRGYELAWLGRPDARTRLEELRAHVLGAFDHGLSPLDYHLELLNRLPEADGASSACTWAAFDAAATDGFLTLGSHYLSGRILQRTLRPDWNPKRRSEDLVSMLRFALAVSDVTAPIDALLPQFPEYRALVLELASLRARLRLVDAMGAWPLGLFSETGRWILLRHGLALEARLLANLERWRWLPETLGERHVWVDVAAFALEARSLDLAPERMAVIVGKKYRATPSFSGEITYLVLNPSWHVPPRIAQLDIVPEAAKDPSYLMERGFQIFPRSGTSTIAIDPTSLDWSQSPETFGRYRFVQRPGPKNALGSIKIMFPNAFDVYLHGTPHAELFTKKVRTFSSGCIRVERPIELALWLLSTSPEWNRGELETALATGLERTVILDEPVPIHIGYFTARVDAAGVLHLMRDVYERDSPLARALALPPPGR